MSKPSYAERISTAEVMGSGLSNNADQVTRRGIDEEFRTRFEAHRQAAIALNNEQEKLKADTKAKTAELDAKMDELDKAMTEAKKVVKMEFPQAKWVEFGINDKR